MSRRRVLFAALALGLVCLAAALVWRNSGQPRYGGRTLSEWLAICVPRRGRARKPAAEVQAAQQAVRQIGANALPYLMEWMRDGSEPWQLKLDGMLERVASGGAAVPQSTAYGEFVSRKRDWAMAGFRALGAQGAPAAPSLVKLMIETNLPNLSAAAAEALGVTGTQGLPPLLSALNQPGHQRHRVLVNQLGYLRNMGSNAAPLIPILAADCSSADSATACAAARALGKLRIEPDLSIPALTRCLASDDPMTRSEAAFSLGRFGPLAKTAIPALLPLGADASPRVRLAATNALVSIGVNK